MPAGKSPRQTTQDGRNADLIALKAKKTTDDTGEGFLHIYRNMKPVENLQRKAFKLQE